MEERLAPQLELIRRQLGHSIHAAYRHERQEAQPITELTMASWKDLPEGLRASNIAQAADIAAKLARIGCVITPVGASGGQAALSSAEVELRAEIKPRAATPPSGCSAGGPWGKTRNPEYKRNHLPGRVGLCSRRTLKTGTTRPSARFPYLLVRMGLGIRRISRPT